MWNYEKRLEYPINIKQTNPALAAMIISQYGGPDGELRCFNALYFATLHHARPCCGGTSYRYWNRRICRLNVARSIFSNKFSNYTYSCH